MTRGAERPSREGQILEAAARVFNSRGYHAATVDEVAAAAGLGKGTIYLYFAGKRELYGAVARRGIQELLDRAAGIARSSEAPREKLRRVVHNHVEQIGRFPGLDRLLLGANVGGEVAGDDDVSGLRAQYLKVIEAVLAEGVQREGFRLPSVDAGARCVLGMLCAAGGRGQEVRTVESILFNGLAGGAYIRR